MKSLKENLPYVLLILIAFALIFTTIRLQALIMSTRFGPGTGQAPSGLLTTLRQQIAFAIMPPTDTPTITPVPPTATFTPTSLPPTPVPPSATPLPTLTSTPLPPTPVPPTLAPPSPTALPTETVAQSPTSVPPSPTTAILVPTFTATATPLPLPTNTPTPDLRLGYMERGDGCGVVTEIVQRILENNLKYRVERVAFTDAAELFAKVASTDARTKVDWTMCYIDPDDRSYLEQYSGFLVVIGGVYGQPAGKNHLIMSNGPFKREIQQNKRCVLELLKDFTLEASPLQGQSAQAWLDTHAAQVQTWTRCQ